MKVYEKHATEFNETGGYDSCYITKLVNNYRSHPAILKLPSDLFYDGDIITCADPIRSHSLCQWEHLVKPGFPIIFHGVDGLNEREGNSPSWFNVTEAQIVKQYVTQLCENTRVNRVLPQDIGIITPYAKQSQKLRSLMKEYKYDDVSVGSVEQFQGQERRVIIISTVRTSEGLIDFDVQHNLGFLVNPKRFNVAITRAQALLIIIGCPAVLARDEHWNQLLWYCHDNTAYIGPPLPERKRSAGSNNNNNDNDNNYNDEDGIYSNDDDNVDVGISELISEMEELEISDRSPNMTTTITTAAVTQDNNNNGDDDDFVLVSHDDQASWSSYNR